MKSDKIFMYCMTAVLALVLVINTGLVLSIKDQLKWRGEPRRGLKMEIRQDSMPDLSKYDEFVITR